MDEAEGVLAIARPLRRSMKRATPVALSILIRNSSLEKWSRISLQIL